MTIPFLLSTGALLEMIVELEVRSNAFTGNAPSIRLVSLNSVPESTHLLKI